MRLWKSWLIARKDLKILWRRKSLMAFLLVIPIGLSVALPVVIHAVILRRGFSPTVDSNLIGAFGFFFVIFGAVIPLMISSYSIVGEKVEKSLEPLLSTPTSDGEVLMGKYIGAIIPSLISVYLADIIYMTLIDLVTVGKFGYLYFPNWAFSIIMLVATPIASTYAITLSVFVSSRVDSVITAYQSGGVTLIPFLILYVMGEIGLVNLNDTTNILIISGVLIVAALVTYYVSRAMFGREEILTQWK